MENCNADNIAEKLFRSYWKLGQLSLCKKHLYQGLSLIAVLWMLGPSKMLY